MTVRLDGETIRLEGACRVEEAEALTALVQDHPAAAVDLSGCTELHGALLQVLLAQRVRTLGESADPFLARWLSPILSRQALAKEALS